MKPSKSSLTDTHILLLLGLALFLLHMFTNHQYGFHQDEMVVLDNANNLDWGFVEYPPLTPFLARMELTLFGLSLVSARTFAALAHSIVLVLTGLMARELGARRPAQILAAIAAAIAPIALTQGSLIQYVTFDFLWSVLIAYLMIRLPKSGDARWWLAIGAVIGLGMMTKYTMVMFVSGLVGGVFLTDTSEVHDIFTEQIGWQEMIQTVAGIYEDLPSEQKAQAGILAGENDEVAALNLYGLKYGLPKAISGSDTFFLRGYGNPPPETLIMVGFSQKAIDSLFEQCAVAGTITNPYSIENDLRDLPDIFVCRNPLLPWPEL